MATTTATTTAPTTSIEDQAPKLLSSAAGYVGHRTVAIGLRSGLVETLAGHDEGLTPEGLADRLGLDELLTQVWCRAGIATDLLVRDEERVRLAPHMDTLLLDDSSPAYVGALFLVLQHDEVFDRFERTLPTGERLWWDDCSDQWIAAVAGSGKPFNIRLVPDGLAAVPGLTERLSEGARIIDTACGAGIGAVRLAKHYPACHVVGVDGDAHSIELARQRATRAGLDHRVRFRQASLEEMTIDEPAALVVNNISMHECRDIDGVTTNVFAGLEPGGWFVISDFPFPEDDTELRSVPGQLMAGIQFFEAQLDDQLLPRRAYDELLERHDFTHLGNTTLAPVHALTWGRRPT